MVDLFAADLVQDRRERTYKVPTDFDVETVSVEYAVYPPEIATDPTFTLDTELWGLFDSGWVLLKSAEFPGPPVSLYQNAAPAQKIRVVFEPSRLCSIAILARFHRRGT